MHGGVKLVAAHDVAEGKEQAGEQEHDQKEANHVLAFKHTLPAVPLSPSRRHAYFDAPPNDFTQLLIISIGSGKTMVVFFSTPISVRVWR